jgi:hypothetical protein
MGAWGSGPFENDDACDWVYELEESHDLTACLSTLMSVRTTTDYLELDGGAQAIAAAEVVAALSGRARSDLPEAVDAWISQHPIDPTADDLALAVAALDRVLAPDSEIRALWAESGDEPWRSGVDDLRDRLLGLL